MSDPVEEPQEEIVDPPEVSAEEPQEPALDDKGEPIKDPEKAIHFDKKPEPPEGSKRWKEIYHEAKEGARKLAEFETKFKERDADIDALRKHNQELARALEAKEQAKQDTAIAQTKVTEQQQLSGLQAQRDAAVEEVDYAKAFQIQKQIDSLILHMAKPKPEEIKKISKTASVEEEINSAVKDFSKKAEWFEPKMPDGRKNPNYDPAKRGMAIALETDLGPEWTGSYHDLLFEVKRQVEERFAEKKADPKPPVPGVAGVVPKSPPSAATTVQLSADQKRVARMMFVDDPDGEKKYAAQLKAMGRA